MTQPLRTLQSQWKNALATHLVMEDEPSRLKLIQLERDYTFLWRRTRHRMKWPLSRIGAR